MPLTTRHRGRRRSRIQKCVWPTVAVLSAAASAKSEGFGASVPSVPYEFANEPALNASASAPIAGSFDNQTPRYSELETINLNPAPAIRLLDNLFLDNGLGAMWSLKQYYSFWDASEGHVNANGEGWSWGNIGLTWNFARHQHLSLTYRSPMDVDYDSHFTTDNITLAEAGSGAISSFNSAVIFPAIVGIGYGIELTKAISLETDFEWLDFARYNSSDLNTGNSPVSFSKTSQSASSPQSGHSILASGVGADWKFADHWVFRAGYQFFENPVHNSAFSPSIPDVNQHVFTLGIGWNGKHGSVELAYGMDFYYDRHIANDQQPGFDGAYGFNGHLLSLAYKFSF